MTLKNVVLPAPLGPMRLTIEPRSISRSTSWTASSPPNRFVTFWASRIRSRSGAAVAISLLVADGAGRGRHVGNACLGACPQLSLSPPVREQSLGPQQHHRHERQPVQQVLVLDEVDLLEDRDVLTLEELVQLLEQDALDLEEDERTDRDAPGIAHSAEDDRRQNGERDR